MLTASPFDADNAKVVRSIATAWLKIDKPWKLGSAEMPNGCVAGPALARPPELVRLSVSTVQPVAIGASRPPSNGRSEEERVAHEAPR